MTNKPQDDEWVGVVEFAAIANISPGTLRYYRSSNRPKGHPIPPFERRHPDTGVMQWRRGTAEAWHAERHGQGARTDLLKDERDS